MNNYLISVIIPTLNRADLIRETLDSLLAQTYKEWECIVVDDGSTDNTVEVVKAYTNRDTRFKLYSRPAVRKKGASSCRNLGVELSRGELIQFLDSDDLLGGNKLEEQVKLYKGELTLLTCKWGGFDKTTDLDKRFKFKYNSYRNFKNGIDLLKTFGEKDEFFPPHVYLTPRKLIEVAGGWNEELTNNDDAEFFTRIILSATRIKFTSKTAVYYRYSGSDKLSSFTDEERILSAIKSWKLIESHIRDKYPDLPVPYVDNAKRFLKDTIKGKFPEIIKEEQSFFIRKGDFSFYSRIKHFLKL